MFCTEYEIEGLDLNPDLAALDGIAVIRTHEKKRPVPTAAVVRTCKDLNSVERAFRSLKTLDLHVRPIRHRRDSRARAHIFLCMLAYYVQRHMQEAQGTRRGASSCFWTRTREQRDPRPRRARAALQGGGQKMRVSA